MDVLKVFKVECLCYSCVVYTQVGVIGCNLNVVFLELEKGFFSLSLAIKAKREERSSLRLDEVIEQQHSIPRPVAANKD